MISYIIAVSDPIDCGMGYDQIYGPYTDYSTAEAEANSLRGVECTVLTLGSPELLAIRRSDNEYAIRKGNKNG